MHTRLPFVGFIDSRPRSANGRFALYRPSEGRLSLEPPHRSLADWDTLRVSLRGLRTRRSSGQQAPGRHARPRLPLFCLLLSVPWSGECPEEYKALGLTMPPSLVIRADRVIPMTDRSRRDR